MANIPKESRPQWVAKSRPKQNANAEFYRSTAWRKLRHIYKMRHPLCRHCMDNGIINPSQEIDHVVPISAGGEKLDWSNLQALCKRCHSIKTARDRDYLCREGEGAQDG